MSLTGGAASAGGREHSEGRGGGEQAGGDAHLVLHSNTHGADTSTRVGVASRGDLTNVWPTSTGSGRSSTPNARTHARRHLARQRHQLGRRGLAAIDERERVLGGDPGASVAVPALEAGVLDQPRRGRLDPPVRLRPARRVAGERRARLGGSRIGLVKNEPALTESGSPGSITMPLPRRRPSTASRTSASGGAVADRARPACAPARRSVSGPETALAQPEGDARARSSGRGT